MYNIEETIYKQNKKMFGKSAVLGTKTTTVFFKPIKDKTGSDYKYCFLDKEINAVQGNIIFSLNANWIIIDKDIELNDIYSKCVVRKCQQIKCNNIIIYAAVDSSKYDINTSKYIDFVDNQILITIPDIYTDIIKINDIVEFNKKGYKIIAIDDTVKNLLILKCNYDAANTKHYIIKLKENSTNIYPGDTYQIIANVSDDVGLVSNPTIIYKSDNNAIVTVNSTGLVTAVALGTVNITITYENATPITFNVTIVEKPEEKPLVLSGPVNLYLPSKTATYKVQHSDNSPVLDKTFIFSLEKSDKTSSSISDLSILASIQSCTDTSCILLAGKSKSGYLNLKATCKEDSSIVIKKEIWIRYDM